MPPLNAAHELTTEGNMIDVLRLLRLSLLAAPLLLPAGSAEAARNCGERVKFSKHLASKYKEHSRALGVLQSGKAVFEVYVSQEGSWTLLMTMTNGATCIMAAGHSWQEKDRLSYLPKS